MSSFMNNEPEIVYIFQTGKYRVKFNETSHQQSGFNCKGKQYTLNKQILTHHEEARREAADFLNEYKPNDEGADTNLVADYYVSCGSTSIQMWDNKGTVIIPSENTPDNFEDFAAGTKEVKPAVMDDFINILNGCDGTILFMNSIGYIGKDIGEPLLSLNNDSLKANLDTNNNDKSILINAVRIINRIKENEELKIRVKILNRTIEQYNKIGGNWLRNIQRKHTDYKHIIDLGGGSASYCSSNISIKPVELYTYDENNKQLMDKNNKPVKLSINKYLVENDSAINETVNAYIFNQIILNLKVIFDCIQKDEKAGGRKSKNRIKSKGGKKSKNRIKSKGGRKSNRARKSRKCKNPNQ